MRSYILFDGKHFESHADCLSAANRSFRYGDGLFETIRVCRGKVLWAEPHFQRLARSAATMKFIMPEGFSVKEFTGWILNLYRMNHPKGEPARIRFSMFRKDGGLYTPESNQVSFLIESEKLKETAYGFHERGLDIDIYPDQNKAVNQLSPLKTSSALLYVMAALYKKENGFDDCLLLNQYGNIAEAISSNVFVVCGDKLITPGLDQGCVDGVMRTVLLRLSAGLPITIKEAPLHPSVMMDADEVFLTNTISGITWVRSFRERMYANHFASNLHRLLNAAVAEA
jgi:branched-subunit amino acid aminotransferase/4-amino-4-deoxychorismate lyase